MFELKDIFRAIIKQDSEKKNVIRNLSSCIIEKFNGFNIVRFKKDTKSIECFFSNKINFLEKIKNLDMG